MSTETHTPITPGRWEADWAEVDAISQKGGRVTVADCGTTLPQPECIANARLIAAAPDLLAACQAGAAYSNALRALQDSGTLGAVVESGENNLDELFMRWHDLTHAAISKAKGETE